MTRSRPLLAVPVAMVLLAGCGELLGPNPKMCFEVTICSAIGCASRFVASDTMMQYENCTVFYNQVGPNAGTACGTFIAVEVPCLTERPLPEPAEKGGR